MQKPLGAGVASPGAAGRVRFFQTPRVASNELTDRGLKIMNAPRYAGKGEGHEKQYRPTYLLMLQILSAAHWQLAEQARRAELPEFEANGKGLT